MIAKTHVILYVRDQERSARFYASVLAVEPRLHVPGMTEFDLGRDCVLGLMPVAGIRRLLGDRLPDPDAAAGVPRAELYLYVDDVVARHERALAAGATALSAPEARSWGDVAAYSLDPDGHVLAFATFPRETAADRPRASVAPEPETPTRPRPGT